MFLTFLFNTLVHVWIVNLLARGEVWAAVPELSILLEGLPKCVRGSSSEGRRSELLSPAIHPDQWLALWWANSLTDEGAKGARWREEQFLLTNINIRSKGLGSHVTISHSSALWGHWLLFVCMFMHTGATYELLYLFSLLQCVCEQPNHKPVLLYLYKPCCVAQFKHTWLSFYSSKNNWFILQGWKLAFGVHQPQLQSVSNLDTLHIYHSLSFKNSKRSLE